MGENDSTIGIESKAGISLSVVVCTYGRPESVVTTLRSILDAATDFAELIVVDQNEDLDTYQALCPLLSDDRLRYFHVNGKGLGRARNVGLERAECEIVAFTDDDCTVSPDWLEGYRHVFTAFPEVNLCYGSVLAADHDHTLGYIPDYTIPTNRFCRTLRAKLSARGIGANFAMRRSAVKALGGFDLRLGAGGDLCSAEDRDLTLRCLLAGHGVYEYRDSIVFHHGFRDWARGRVHTWKDWFGLGAVYAKPLRAGRWRVLPYMLHEFVRYALLPFLVATLTFRSQRGWTRISAFFAGFIQGWRSPIDRQSLCYLSLTPEQVLSSHEQNAAPRT